MNYKPTIDVFSSIKKSYMNKLAVGLSVKVTLPPCREFEIKISASGNQLKIYWAYLMLAKVEDLLLSQYLLAILFEHFSSGHWIYQEFSQLPCLVSMM